MLIKANEGNIYNITDAFTTTADFIEGTGKKHVAVSNVVVVEDTAAVYTDTADTSVNADGVTVPNRYSVSHMQLAGFRHKKVLVSNYQ